MKLKAPNLTWRTRKRLKTAGILLGSVLALALAAWLCWILWLGRFVVYSRDAVRLDFNWQTPGPFVTAEPPQEPTINLTRHKTGASTLCKHFGCGITVCDVGVNAEIREPKVLGRKIAYGTNNIVSGPAMTRQQCIRAIRTGFDLARDTEADVLGIGEMGIGNTTTSSAVLAILLGADVESVTGRGGGITDQSFLKKKQVIKTAIEVNRPDKTDVIDVLAKVGGFDIAAMCGAFLGAAATRRPVVIDGFISAVAALCAFRLCPDAVGYFIPSHASYEIGYGLAMDAMGLQPLFLLGMRLGEGSGCPLAFQILEAACAVINDMATFDQAGIDDGYLDEIRQGDNFTVEGAR